MTTNKSWEEKLRQLWHVRSVNMAQEVTDYSKVEGMIADWWIDKAKEVEKEAYQRAVEETEKKYEPLLIHSTRVENEKLLVTLELRDPKNVTHFYKREELQALKGEEIK